MTPMRWANSRLRCKTIGFWRSVVNRRKGYMFDSIQRCRVCGHTAYSPEHPGHGL